MGTNAPRIAVISAVTSAWAPTHRAFANGFPEADLWNLLDDRLLEDATAAGGLDPALEARMHRLIENAREGRARAVLLTCSVYGPVAHRENSLQLPVHAPDDALFAAVRTSGARTVGIVSTGPGPLADSVHRLRSAVGPSQQIVPVLAEGARAALARGDIATAVDSVVHGMRAVPALDLLALGQYSLAPITDALDEATGLPVLSGPDLAVSALRSALEGSSRSGAGDRGAGTSHRTPAHHDHDHDHDQEDPA